MTSIEFLDIYLSSLVAMEHLCGSSLPIAWFTHNIMLGIDSWFSLDY